MLGERAWLVVNDRVDVALALRAEAVQLGRWSLPIEAVRRLAPGLRVGASIHYAAEASLPADYLLLGTIYATASHPGEPGSGVALIAQVASETRTPIVAIGGIDGTNARACAAAGAQGVAVISAIAAAADPRAAAIALRRELET
jgi:thiazole tautomerase (transcriptional regulator TenI)